VGDVGTDAALLLLDSPIGAVHRRHERVKAGAEHWRGLAELSAYSAAEDIEVAV
jgi:hypothetical protein